MKLKSTLFKAKTVRSTAPTRIDLAGGTLDVWPLAPILQEKYELWNTPLRTVNVAIDLRASAELTLDSSPEFAAHFVDLMTQNKCDIASLTQSDANQFPLHRCVARYFKEILMKQKLGKIELKTNAMVPKGSGLGGSSSLMIAMLHAFETMLDGDFDNNQLCLRAQNLEAGVLANLAGNQDHYAAAYGGVQAVCHSADGSTSSPIMCDGKDMLSHIVLAHSGQQHFSAFNNWLILEKALTGDNQLLSKCADIAKIAHSLVPVLEKNNWKELAKLMAKEWEIRRTLAPGITTPILDNLYATGIKAGATGGKVCGAGGGGVLVMLLPEPQARRKIEKSIAEAGGVIMSAGFSENGVESEVLL